MLITVSEVKASRAHNLLEFIGVAARQVNSKVHTGTTNDHTDRWEGRTAYYTGYLPRLYILVLSTMSYKIYQVSGYCMNVSGNYSYGKVGTARE